ncbi:GHMP family kinase ATP-binding protein [Shouchella lehensis]|uniref:PduX-type propanediol utilization/coumermycin biosynthesis protein n=1 Tax=Shouchella lehensis G1 TaxID=1246626 RepID=A0A060LXV4_9BACI|nr:kinase [Shouchella lehensis]AIC93108.1 PduX-type propanediol utilization/coumermycin biosynthesis protein [Shouchella lehensis G1]
MNTLIHEEILASNKVGKGISFGTFGELLQGVQLDNDVDFLVTLPIKLYSQAEFYPDSSGSLKVVPELKQKSSQLAINLLNYFNLPTGGTLSIKSDLPEGKGLASSSADLVATARAIDSYYKLNIENDLLERLMKEVEPSDGVMYPAVVSFYHRKVQLEEVFGSIPPLTIIAIDEGGEVDTLEYNKFPKTYTPEEKAEYTLLKNKLKYAFEEQNVIAIGEVATRSAIMNQTWQEKKSLEYFLHQSKNQGALGVVVAHSGTYIGLLLCKEDKYYKQKLNNLHFELESKFEKVYFYDTI